MPKDLTDDFVIDQFIAVLVNDIESGLSIRPR